MPSPRIRKMSLSRALDKYLKTVSVHKKGHQQEFYRSNVIKRYPIALRNMDEITTVDIATYRDVRLAEINPRTGKPITGNTVRLELALLSSLFNIARVEWGTCRTNPVELVRKPKVSSGRDRRLTSSEERRLSRYFREKNLMLYVIFHLALETAMRQGEILALRWEHIDLRHGVAHLPETKNGHSRDVPLSRRARNFLQMMPVNLHGNVFDYTASGFKNAWRIATQRLRIEDLHFHDLRHEAISRFFELGSLVPDWHWPTCQSGTWKSSSASIWTNIKTFTLYPKNTQVLGRFKLCINTYRIDGREMAETEVVPIDMPDSNGEMTWQAKNYTQYSSYFMKITCLK
ncbi:phage integrase family site-specific recombinase [Shigella sonnei]|nr:site-specific integrase [Shigella sonnei]CTA53430.1 phage integrase family site-specific recombinase [Shigella sonnei]